MCKFILVLGACKEMVKNNENRNSALVKGFHTDSGIGEFPGQLADFLRYLEKILKANEGISYRKIYRSGKGLVVFRN